MNEAWWVRWPDLLEAELEAFRRHRTRPDVDFRANGILTLKVDWPLDSAPLELRVGFSPLHPFFPPRVSAPRRSFERHQHPISKDLCLLTQETGQWNSSELVADFLSERVSHLLGALQARSAGRLEEASELEEQVGDPYPPYVADASEPDSILLYGGDMAMPRERHGLLKLAARSRARHGESALELVLGEVATTTGRMLNRFKLPGDELSDSAVLGRWIKFEPPRTTDAEIILKAVDEELEKRAVMQAADVKTMQKVTDAPIFVTGVMFADEIEYGDKSGVGWLFLLSRRSPEGVTTRLVRAERAAETDIFQRLPVAVALRRKSVLLIGCGAIGSFVAIELARAGVGRISMLDSDIVQPGNSVRWPLGRPVWGTKKAFALAEFILSNYPWTDVSGTKVERVGETVSDRAHLSADFGPNLNPYVRLREAVAGADVVVDTSAMLEVQQALSFHCRDLGVPYVMGHATAGAFGGIVARFVGKEAGCRVCLNEHWVDGAIPEPREDTKGSVVPVGCNHPTFLGGGFDLQEVSLEVVRTAVGLLSEGEYDPGAWSVAVLNLRDDAGKRTPPRWTTHECTRHARCSGCMN